MARKPRERIYDEVTITADELETLEEGTELRVKYWKNPPIRVFKAVEDSNLSSALIDFMKEMIVEWNGYDLPCDERGFGELEPFEMRAIIGAVAQAVTTPNS